jgi:hypothetical protein
MSHDRRLAELHHPRRNRYFAGKLLAASDLEMEQDYVRGADAQLAQHVLGAGVVCGLDVTAGRAGDRPGIRVGAGLALDGWGRRIVVPRDVEIALPARVPPPASMVVALRYEVHEADVTPSVPGDDEDRSEAGTWVEGHRVEIREGARRRPRANAARRRSSSSAPARSRRRSRCWHERHARPRRPTPARRSRPPPTAA